MSRFFIFRPTLHLLFVFGLLLSIQTSSQGQTFQTAIGYSFPTEERGVSGLITNNGEYLVLASNLRHPAGLYNPSGDMSLLRLDLFGNLIQPCRMIGQDVMESGVWMEKATDCSGSSGYIVAGNRFDNANYNMLLMFTNPAGVPQWVREIGTANSDEKAVCVKPDGAGNFILVGTKTNPSTGLSVIQAVKTDCGGNLLWERIYRINGSVQPASVTAFATFQNTCPAAPDAYFITGTASGTGANDQVFILSVLAANGNVGWMKSYDIAPNADDAATCIQGDCSGKLWVSGHSLFSAGADPKQILMMQTDFNGNVQWANQYNILNSDLEWPNHFQVAANQRLVLTGKAEDPGVSDPPENGQCMLMRIKNDGSGLDWTRVYDMGYASSGQRVEPTASNEYFITGHTFTIAQPHQFDYNILAIKTNSIGETNSACFHTPETQISSRQPVVTPIQPTPITPQDFFQTALQTTLYDDKQTFCPDPDPCQTLGLTANFNVSGTGNTLNFTDLSNPGAGTIFSWSWDFGDANTSNLQHPTHTYASPGVYTVCLIVTGGTAGMLCRDTICKDVLVPFEPLDSCVGNIVLNGNFSQGLTPGNLGFGGTCANWSTWTNSPQVITGDYCQGAGAMQMWGNQVVGESIWQNVSFQAGGVYEVSFCGKWFSNNGNVQIRFRASNGFPGSYNACGGNCDDIFLSPVISTSWNTYVSLPWTATQNFNTLTISVWNNFAVNDGAYVSWARIDDVCIRRIGTTETHESGGMAAARLFPNPTTGDVRVAFGEALASETLLLVFDLRGRLLQQQTIEQGTTEQTLSLESYPAGIYLVRALQNGRQVWSEKVVKE